MAARTLIVLALWAACSSPARPMTPAPTTVAAPCATAVACEQQMTARLEAVRGDRARLTEVLRRFPKGGDLHNHLSGAVYAESYLAWAREDGMWLDHDTLVATRCATCTALPSTPEGVQQLVAAWSMQGFDPRTGAGPKHFFDAFSKFRAESSLEKRQPAILAEVIRRAADEGTLYLETLITVAPSDIVPIVDQARAAYATGFAAYKAKLVASPGWNDLIAKSKATLIRHDQQARALLRCDTPAAERGCNVVVRYQAQVGRTSPPERAYAELLAAYEVAKTVPQLVAINLVQPEHDPHALQYYAEHMRVIAALAADFSGHSPIRITLHAGELTPALAPHDTGSHIRQAIDVAHAERIGHGVDVLGEANADQLLRDLRDRNVLVEICLSSNAYILGIEGDAHPLGKLIAAGVPVALATDDPGVSRSSLTGELVRAVTVQGLRYPQLKAMARASLTAAFVPGVSLWAAPGRVVDRTAPPFGGAADRGQAPVVEACAAPGPACDAFLATSERARLQWKLEQQFAAFERAP